MTAPLEFVLQITKLKCPECGGWSHVKSEKFDACPHCGVRLEYCDIEQYHDADVTVTVNRLTGEAVVL